MKNTCVQRGQFSEYQRVTLVSYVLGCFLLPLFLSLLVPYYVLGTLVNGAIIFVSLRFSWSVCLPIIMLPALGVLGGGLLFGEGTAYLLYLFPFIWCGNVALSYGLKRLKSKGNAFRILGCALAKVGIIAIGTLVISLICSPFRQLLFVMTIGQCITIVSGTLLYAAISTYIP